mgnify:CR=1 FL=1
MKKSISAFRISGTREGWNYPTFSATFRTENESEAIERAKALAKDESIFTAEKIIVHHVSDKLQNDDYPYGRERATAFFSVEHNAGKGFRNIFQTINPKNGRLNNPKKGTYSPVMLPCTVESNGHFQTCGVDFNGNQAMNEGLIFMSEFFECFEPDQIKDIAAHAVMMSKVGAKAMVIYTGAKWEDLKPLVEESIKTLVSILKTGENKFQEALISVDQIEALKVPDFNPFKVTEYQLV